MIAAAAARRPVARPVFFVFFMGDLETILETKINIIMKVVKFCEYTNAIERVISF